MGAGAKKWWESVTWSAARAGGFSRSIVARSIATRLTNSSVNSHRILLASSKQVSYCEAVTAGRLSSLAGNVFGPNLQSHRLANTV